MIKEKSIITSEDIYNIIQSQVIFSLRTRSRKEKYVKARCLYYKIAYDIVGNKNVSLDVKGESLTEIGRVVGKDHATVLHGLKTFESYSYGPAGANFLKNYNKIKLTVLRRIVNKEKDNKELHSDIQEKFLIQRIIHLKSEIETLKKENKDLKNKIRENKIELSPLEALVIDIPKNKHKIAEERIRAMVKML